MDAENSVGRIHTIFENNYHLQSNTEILRSGLNNAMILIIHLIIVEIYFCKK